MSSDELFALSGELVERVAPSGATCKTCRWHVAYDVHYSGPPKIVHYCKLHRAGRSGKAHVTRLKWVCSMWAVRDIGSEVKS